MKMYLYRILDILHIKKIIVGTVCRNIEILVFITVRRVDSELLPKANRYGGEHSVIS
jgi:hypothetical protein